MLLEPATLGLDRRQREQVAQRLEQRRLPRPVHARSPSAKACSSTRSTWARAAASRWSCAALNTANGSSAPGARRNRRASVSSRCRSRNSNISSCQPRSSRTPPRRAGRRRRAAAPAGVRRRFSTTVSNAWSVDEAGGAEPVELAEVVAVAGEQLLGDELQQDGVVTLERREHVGVGLEPGQPVLGEVAGAAARLAAVLDRARGVPRPTALMPAARASSSRRRVVLGSSPCVGDRSEWRRRLVQHRDELELREVHRVGRANAGSSLRWWAR